MSAKFSASRKRAFLTYLSQTGNQTLSAERAKVSRSWVCLHRSQDAEFDSACRAAIAGAAERLSAPSHPAQPSAESPSAAKGRGADRWRYLHGVELVVGGSNRRHAQVRRARVKQWTPRVEKRFLSALTATCNVRAACAEVGMWPPSAYNHRRRWPAFEEKWHKAVETGYLRIEAALIEAGCNLFSEPEIEPEIRIEGMTVWHAMQVLYMHRRRVRGIGGRPGRKPNLLASDQEVVKALKRALRVSGCDVDAELAKMKQPRK